MEKEIDCLLIGHNETDFQEYERTIRQMGISSGAYRDLNRKFIRCNNRPLPLVEIFNLFSAKEPLRLAGDVSPTIAYLGTYLKRRGFTFDYVNSFNEQKEELAEKLARENISTVAVTTTLYVTVFPLMEVVDFVKQYNSSARVIVGGPFINSQYRNLDAGKFLELLNYISGVDIYVVSSQGETTLVKIMDALNRGMPLDGISNIYFKSGDRYVSTGLVPENNRLSENPVDWNLFAHRLGDVAEIRTSISCLFSCSYCGYPELAGKYQDMDAAAVEKELNILRHIKAVKSIHFIDDTFNVPAKRFKDILRMMIKNKYPFRWHSFFRCQYGDREMVQLMKESGCEGVFIGFESGNNQVLKIMRKGATVEKYLEAMALLKEYGITTFGSFVIGFPGETPETAADTAAFIKESGLDFYRANLWCYSPFTPIGREARAYDLKGINYDWTHKTMDSGTALDLIDRMFLTIENPIWVTLYNFDFFDIFRLIHRGMTPDQVKLLLKNFNDAVKEKILKPAKQEAGHEIITKISEICRGNLTPNQPAGSPDQLLHKYKANFDY